MKHIILKSLAVMALFTASASAADVVINLTGSTAYRAATHAAILSALGTPTYAYNEATASDGLNKATYAIFKGTSVGDNIIVRVFWAGSVEGVQYPSTGATINKFIPTTQSTAASPGTNLGNTTYTDGGVVHAGMSDVYKASAGYPNADLDDTLVGVCPFAFISHPNAPFTNVNAQQMKLVYQQGYAFLNNFVPGGSTTAPVYGCGRNADSGTRITVLAETGYGYTNTVSQYTATVTSTATTSFTQNANPNSGASSGSTMAKTLIRDSSDSVGWGIGYCGVADIQGANDVLTFNGVPYSTDNVKNGTYTLWGYEHLFVAAAVRDSTAGENFTRKTWINLMKAALIANPTASLGVPLADMKVFRAGDGAAISNDF